MSLIIILASILSKIFDNLVNAGNKLGLSCAKLRRDLKGFLRYHPVFIFNLDKVLLKKLFPTMNI